MGDGHDETPAPDHEHETSEPGGEATSRMDPVVPPAWTQGAAASVQPPAQGVQPDEAPTTEVPVEPVGEPTAEGPAWVPPVVPPPPTDPGAGPWGGDQGGPAGWGVPAMAASPPPHRPGRSLRVAAVAAVVALAAAAVGAGVGHAVWSSSGQSAQGSTSPNGSSTTPGGSSGQSPFGQGDDPYGEQPFGSNPSGGSSEGAGGPSDVSAIAAKVSPALVDINSTFSYQRSQGAGTGIVLTSKGEVITNNHVIDGATKISATDVGNGKTYDATVVGYDPSHDIAVLQLKGASGLATAKIGNSANAAVGQAIVAIGNAGGTGGTPSSAGGSITALNQSITASDALDGTSEQLSGLIQVNANIQPGDSGGSLVDTSGAVIGIDTAASSGYSFNTAANEGYAIPINEAMGIAKAIEAGNGSSDIHVGATAFLGVMVSSGSSGGEGEFFGRGGSSGGSGTSGAAVTGVVSGDAAARAGLAQGDVITQLGGQPVDSASTLSHLMLRYHPGDSVQLTWTDTSGQSHTTTVDLGGGPPA